MAKVTKITLPNGTSYDIGAKYDVNGNEIMDYATKEYVDDTLASGLKTKQDTLIAGDNITIENNVISASISGPEPEIPIAYRILEYAQSDGAAWIDTGVTINGAYTLKEELSVPKGKIGAAMVAHHSQNMRQGFMAFNTASHKIARFWPSVDYTDVSVDSNINLGNKFSVIQDSSSITVAQGSYSTTATYAGGTGTDTKTMHLLHSDNPNHASYMNGTLYSAQILDSSDYILDMVPVQRKSDNVVGMFDKVSKTFFDSDGTGVFLAGPIVDENTGGSDLSTKMDKTNPTGTGMFSLNRKAGSVAGDYSFAEGMDTTASGNYSHAEGFATIAAGDCQHVSGKYNIEDTNGEYLVIVGNGTGDTSRSNAVAIKDDGSLVLAGGVTFTPADLQELYNLIHPTT